jgi:hypothetical protein
MHRLWIATIAMLGLCGGAAFGNYAATVGAGTNFGSVVIGGVHFMSNLLCDMTTANQCAAVSAGGAVKVDNSAVTQPVSNAGTFAVQATESGTWTVTQSGNWTMRAVGNAGGVFDAATGAAVPANALYLGANNGGNLTGLVSDANGLWVNIKAGAGSGGTALADEAAFTQGTTSMTPIGCLFINSYTAITTGHAGVASCTSDGSLKTNVTASIPEGAVGDTAWVSGNGSIIAIAKTIANNTGAAIPAGTNAIGNVGFTSQYPAGATAITASATGTTAATTATLAGTAGKTTYICGYSIRANATGAATITDTITGVITATLSSILWVAPLASGIGVDEQIFSPCIPASATNTGIAIVSGAPGAGGTVSSKGWGYQL